MVYIYNETNSKTKHNKGEGNSACMEIIPELAGRGWEWAEDRRTQDSLFTITTLKKKSWKREERLLLKRPYTYIMKKN